MRRITFTIVTTLAVLVLLFSYRTSRDQPITAKTVAVGQAHVVTAPGASTSSKSTQTTAGRARSVTVDGAAADTPYGPLQVEVVITAGRITDVNAIVYPQGSGRDQEINQAALPELRSQVLSAQSVNIAGVSGATFTSQGYVGSLQSALDQAHFK